MKVVFLQSVEAVAYAWEIKDVKDWFLRNFLLPKWLAVPASENIIKETEALREEQKRLRLAMFEKAKEEAKILEWRVLKFVAKSDKWHLYAAIWDNEISAMIKDESNIELGKTAIGHDRIKEVWSHEVKLHLAEWVDVMITVVVESENEKAEDLELLKKKVKEVKQWDSEEKEAVDEPAWEEVAEKPTEPEAKEEA